jgi:hypothetical protein
VDETVGDHLTTIALVGQPEARGLLVADAAAHRDWITQSYVEGAAAPDTFALASRRGARCAIAGSLDEFDEMPPEWGLPRRAHPRRRRGAQRRAHARRRRVAGPPI